MTFRSLKIHMNMGGIAHLGLLLIILGVAGVGGFAYWRVSSYNNNSENSGKSVKNPSDGSSSNTATISDECVEKTGDEVICRLGAISDLSQFASEVRLTMDSGDGSFTSVIKYDGKGNSYVDTGTGIKGITIGNKTYVYMSGTWYDTGSDTSQAPKSSVPSFDFATTAGITYKNRGKKACGSDTCYDYHMSGGILGDGVVTALIGDKDYLPRRIDSDGGLLGKLTMTVEYKDVKISAPEGAKPISSLIGGLQ